MKNKNIIIIVLSVFILALLGITFYLFFPVNLGYGFEKNKFDIFYKGEKIDNLEIDVKTLEALGDVPLYYKDKNNTYYFATEGGPDFSINKVENFHEEIIKNKESENIINTDEKIEKIKEDYLNISECKNCEKIEKSSVIHEGELNKVFFLKDGELKKIAQTFSGETGKNSYEYFYKDNKLFFVFAKIYSYNRPKYWTEEFIEENGGGSDEVFDINKSKILEDRYYFFENKLILWIDEDKKDIKNGEKFLEEEIEILDLSEENIKIFLNIEK